MEPYYERRSAEYDDWYLGAGLFADRDRPGWDETSSAAVEARGLLASTVPDPGRRVRDGLHHEAPPRPRDRDRREPGDAGGVARAARSPARSGRRVRPALPQRQLRPCLHRPLLRTSRIPSSEPGSSRRAAGSRRRSWSSTPTLHDDVEPEQMQERILNDGSSHRVFKRYFTASQLCERARGRPCAVRGPMVRDGRRPRPR